MFACQEKLLSDKYTTACSAISSELCIKTREPREGQMGAAGGYAGGSTALGYKAIDKRLSIDENQAEAVKSIFYMKRYKRMRLREIARE